jgi:uncharacterized protein (DUF302 family)
MPTSMDIGMRRELDTTYEEALAKVPEALKSEGFGILTEIDIQNAMKEKLGVAFRRYKILGACNPPLAHQALSSELEIGLMLPCNVIVYETDDKRSVVAAIDPMKTMAAHAGPEIREVAAAVREKLERVLDRLG